MSPYKQLKSIFSRIYHLQNIHRILAWDEAVMMPEYAGKSRAKVMATLSRLEQQMLSRKKIQSFIDLVKNEKMDVWNTSNLAWMEKKHKIASAIPLKLIEKMTEASFLSQQAWRKLRPQNNWKDFLPVLEKTFSFVKQIAELKSQVLNLNPYDALIDEHASGFSQQSIDSLFVELKNALPPLIHQITVQQQKEKVQEPVGPFSVNKQKKLCKMIAKALDYKFSRGRLDESHHPFSSGDRSDVRITNRYVEDNFLSAIFGVCHETGHALYEQGLPKKWQFQPVGHVNSMAMHESQSLLIEMEFCRSKEFFDYLTPILQSELGHQEAMNADNLHKVITRVKPNLIRVDADEVTYPLHIILRYELEKGLMNGQIKISDLPARWNELMTSYLGISTKDNYKDGIMQDVHWPWGAFGYFPAYTLGRMIAAQLYSTFIKAHPDFSSETKKGNFESLHGWLQKNVYASASSLPTLRLIQNITNEPLSSKYFIDHIKKRYLTPK